MRSFQAKYETLKEQRPNWFAKQVHLSTLKKTSATIVPGDQCFTQCLIGYNFFEKSSSLRHINVNETYVGQETSFPRHIKFKISEIEPRRNSDS